MRKSALIIIILLVLLIISFLTFYFVTRPTYGNDLAGVTKIIQDHDGEGGDLIVLDYVDVAGYRYAGFFEGDNTIGLLVLSGDGRGSFVYENIYRVQSSSIAVFYDAFALDLAGTHGADIVVSKNALLSKVERYVDGTLQETHAVEPGQPAILVMELHSEDAALNVELRCYDALNALITDVNTDTTGLLSGTP